MRLEAVTAIDRAVFAGDERDGGGPPAVGAGGLVVLASVLAGARRGLAATATATGSAAGRTTTGVIGQVAARIKFLLARGECKFLSAIAAGEDTIRVSLIGHHW